MEQEFKVGDCFRLLNNTYYFVISLEEYVKFRDPMAIIITKFRDGVPIRGRLIRINKGMLRSDEITLFDIEVLPELLGEKYIPNKKHKN